MRFAISSSLLACKPMTSGKQTISRNGVIVTVKVSSNTVGYADASLASRPTGVGEAMGERRWALT